MWNFPSSCEPRFTCQLLPWGSKVVIIHARVRVVKLIRINVSLPTEIYCRIKGNILKQVPYEAVFPGEVLAYRHEASCGINRPGKQNRGVWIGIKINC